VIGLRACGTATRGDGVRRHRERYPSAKNDNRIPNHSLPIQRKILLTHTPLLEKRKPHENFFIANFADSESAKHSIRCANRFAFMLFASFAVFARIKEIAAAQAFLRFFEKHNSAGVQSRNTGSRLR
jgi:hypothetical protein